MCSTMRIYITGILTIRKFWELLYDIRQYDSPFNFTSKIIPLSFTRAIWTSNTDKKFEMDKMNDFINDECSSSSLTSLNPTEVEKTEDVRRFKIWFHLNWVCFTLSIKISRFVLRCVMWSTLVKTTPMTAQWGALLMMDRSAKLLGRPLVVYATGKDFHHPFHHRMGTLQ